MNSRPSLMHALRAHLTSHRDPPPPIQRILADPESDEFHSKSSVALEQESRAQIESLRS